MKLNVDIVGQLVPNLLTMSVTLLSTFVLFMMMKKFLWPSVKNYLDKRADKMMEDIKTSNEAKEAALKDRESAKEELLKASEKGQAIVEAAVKEAKDEKANILAQAKAEAMNEKKRAKEQIESERQGMYEAMRKEMVDVALVAASKLLGTQDPESLDKQAVEAFVKDAQNGK